MPSNGTGHRKTKKHHAMNHQNWLSHQGDKPMTLKDLRKDKDKTKD